MSEVQMTLEQLTAERDRLNAEVAALRAASLQQVRNTFAVSLSEFVKGDDGKMGPGKGGFKVTGLGSRFPVTLYPEQWEIIFANKDAIQACYNDPSNKAKSDLLRK